MTKKKPAKRTKRSSKKTPKRPRSIDISQVAKSAEKVSNQIKAALSAGGLTNSQNELDMLAQAQTTLDDMVGTLNRKAIAGDICPQFFKIPLRVGP